MVVVMSVMNSGEAHVVDAPAVGLSWMQLLGLRPPAAPASEAPSSNVLFAPGHSRDEASGARLWTGGASIGSAPLRLPDLSLPPIGRYWPVPDATATPAPSWTPAPPVAEPYPTYSPSPTGSPTPYATATPVVSPTGSPTPYATATTNPSPTGSPSPTPVCNNEWSPDLGIRYGRMIAPADQRNEAQPTGSPTPVPMPMNGTLACAVETATDRDSVTNRNGTTYPHDGIRYTWRAYPGGFHRGTDVNGNPIIAPTASGPSDLHPAQRLHRSREHPVHHRRRGVQVR